MQIWKCQNNETSAWQYSWSWVLVLKGKNNIHIWVPAYIIPPSLSLKPVSYFYNETNWLPYAVETLHYGFWITFAEDEIREGESQTL